MKLPEMKTERQAQFVQLAVLHTIAQELDDSASVHATAYKLAQLCLTGEERLEILNSFWPDASEVPNASH